MTPQDSLKYSQRFCPQTASVALLQNQVSRLQLLLHRPPPQGVHSMSASEDGSLFSLRKATEENENVEDKKREE